MADKIRTSYLYKVTFTPGGETFFVEAGNAVAAHSIGVGLAYSEGLSWYTGVDVMIASENEITDYYGHGTEEE